MTSFPRRLLLHDVGRKLLALLFAVVLFDVLDAKVQGSDVLAVDVVFVDASAGAAVAESPDQPVKLVVQMRADPAAPLVVADWPLPRRLTLRVSGTKDSLERVRARRRTFTWRLGREGLVTLSPDDLEGVASLREELGAGAVVEVDPPFQLTVEKEARRLLKVVNEDLAVTGSVAPGYDRGSRTMTVKPDEGVTLVGPESAVEQAWKLRSELFEGIVLDGQRQVVGQPVELKPRWRDRLRLLGPGGETLDSIKVSIEFKRRMKTVPPDDGGLFELPVEVICNEELLQEKDPAHSWRDGWRLRFPTEPRGQAPRLKLQLSAPEALLALPVPDKLKFEAARDNVHLVVRAHELSGVERGTLPVKVVRFPPDFPEDLEVVLAPGEKSTVEVEWVAPADAASDSPRPEGGDGH